MLFLIKNKLLFTTVALVIIILLATILRVQKVQSMQQAPLDPDAAVYRSLAMRSSAFYDSGFREPLFVFMVKLYTKLFGNEPLTLRYFTVFLSTVSILLIYKTGQELFDSQLIGLLSATFIGFNAYFIFMSIRLLRLELFIIAILLFFYTLFICKRQNYARYVFIGIVGGLVCLTRITSLSFVIPLIVFAFWREKISLVKLLIPVLLIIVMVLPHFIHNKNKFGSYTYSVDIHAKWYRNQEFKDQPGFPTAEQLQKNSYQGRPVTSLEYIFGMHSLPTVISRSIKGFGRIFFGSYRKDFFSANDLLEIFLFGGYILILFTKYRYLWGVMILLIGPTFFLAGTLLLDPRLIAHIYPFMVFITSFCIVSAGKTVFQLIQSRAPADSFIKKWQF
jgi:hypothetical protein